MLNKVSTPRLLPFLTVLACASACGADPSTAELAELMVAHDNAWNAHDPDAMVALVTEDATVIAPQGKRVQGHEALRELYASPGPTKQTTSRTRIDSVQWLTEDIALVDATQSLSGPGVAMMGVSEAHVVAVAKRVDGQWRFSAVRPFPIR